MQILSVSMCLFLLQVFSRPWYSTYSFKVYFYDWKSRIYSTFLPISSVCLPVHFHPHTVNFSSILVTLVIWLSLSLSPYFAGFTLFLYLISDFSENKLLKLSFYWKYSIKRWITLRIMYEIVVIKPCTSIFMK